jgi:protein TonB
MNQFKKTTQKREKRRGIYFQLGLIIAGGLTLVAFEWTSPINISDLPPTYEIDEVEIDFPIIMPEVKIDRPEVKPIVVPTKSDIIVIVKDVFEPDPEPNPDLEPELKFDPDEYKIIEKLPVEPTAPFTIVENMPEFVGGERARLKFLNDNLKYPRVDRAGSVEGTVYLNFLVNKKGEIKKVKILRGVSPTLDAEAIRVVKAMPNWKAGKQRGKAVNVSYNFRIKFKLG